MDDVRTLANCRRRRALARLDVARIRSRHALARLDELPDLAASCRAAGEAVEDFVTTVEVQQMWEQACAGHASDR